ncbi:hypothetical protein [Thalassospira xiamenensis]|uniref:hypothetical protein n=1 Tax=Thalassospira xiamenensis TaxID=220697 RepID=UPI00115CD5C0|nr:hypothetical protein [Thalassospira xiamenensis]
MALKWHIARRRPGQDTCQKPMISPKRKTSTTHFRAKILILVSFDAKICNLSHRPIRNQLFSPPTL